MKFRQFPTEGNFEGVIFAWVDILGFKELVMRSENPSDILKILSSVDFSAQASYDIEISRRIISDAVIFWSSNPYSLFPILNLCGLLQTSILKHGYLVKGFITSDQHFSHRVKEFDTDTRLTEITQDEVMVSKALIKAYTTESSLKLPIIKIDESLDGLLISNRQYYPNFSKMFEAHENFKIVFKYYHTHELNLLRHDFSMLPKTDKNNEEYIEIEKCEELLGIYKKSIIHGLSLPEGPKKYWVYMREQHNLYVDEVVEKNSHNKKIHDVLLNMKI